MKNPGANAIRNVECFSSRGTAFQKASVRLATWSLPWMEPPVAHVGLPTGSHRPNPLTSRLRPDSWGRSTSLSKEKKIAEKEN